MGLDDSSNAGSSTGGSGRKTGGYDSNSDSDDGYSTTNMSKRGGPKYGTSNFSNEEDSDEEQPDFMTHIKRQDEAQQQKKEPAPAPNNPVRIQRCFIKGRRYYRRCTRCIVSVYLCYLFLV